MMKRTACMTAIILLVSTAAFADIARPESTKSPKPKKQIETTLSIRLDRNAKEAKLIIPKSQIKQLRAELEQLDDDSGNTASVSDPGIFTRTRTIVSGMFLSLALVFGGVWFVRSGKAATKSGKVAVLAFVAFGIASPATFIYANAGPPAEARRITGKMFSQAVHIYNYGSGKIKLEAADSDHIELIVPDPAPDSKPAGEE